MRPPEASPSFNLSMTSNNVVIPGTGSAWQTLAALGGLQKAGKHGCGSTSQGVLLQIHVQYGW